MLDHLARNDQIKTLVWFLQCLVVEIDGKLPIEPVTSSEGCGGQITTMNDYI